MTIKKDLSVHIQRGNGKSTDEGQFCYYLLGILTFDYQFGGRFDLAGRRCHPAGEQAGILLVGGADQQHGVVALGDHLERDCTGWVKI